MTLWSFISPAIKQSLTGRERTLLVILFIACSLLLRRKNIDTTRRNVIPIDSTGGYFDGHDKNLASTSQYRASGPLSISRHLTDAQCLETFPGLFDEADRSAKFWKEKGGLSLDDVIQGAGHSHSHIVIKRGEVTSNSLIFQFPPSILIKCMLSVNLMI